jgi:DNA-binding HxlR family transcriptional regulator
MGDMLGKDYDGQDCSIAGALGLIGERWTLLIVRDAFYGVRRFSDFQVHLDVPKAVLSARLGQLVQNGIFDRNPDPGHPGRHLYELTPAGRELWPVLRALLGWGGRHAQTNSRIFRHVTCGKKLDEAGTCPDCKIIPNVEDIVSAPRPGLRASRNDPVAIALRSPHRMLEPLQTT